MGYISTENLGLAYLDASSAKELAEQSDPINATMTP
jgi:hypothetical protein